MTGLAGLALASAAFVGTHFLLSHPLRAPLIRRLGEQAFTALYSLVAIATFIWMLYAYKGVGPQQPLWKVGDPLWLAASLLMWFASILFVGSLRRNPAFPRPGRGAMRRVRRPSGIFAITRHAMNWAFAVWAVVHAAVNPTPASLIASAAIFILAIGGSVAQDLKKEKLLGEGWRNWKSKTAFFPFGRGLAAPGGFPLIAGTMLFLFLTWMHPIPAGFWRWVG